VNKHSAQTTGNIRIMLPEPGPVAAPPIRVLVETHQRLQGAADVALCKELSELVHHHLRFRAKIELQAEGVFQVQTGATGKSKLVEIIGDL
jgi:hypothetical protein